MKKNISDIRKHKFFGPVVALVSIFIIYKIYVWTKTESTENAYVDSYISVVSSEINGSITEILCYENQEVKEGEVLAKIDSATFKAHLESAKSKVKAGEYKLKLTDQKLELENANLQKATEGIKLAQINLDIADRDYKRNISLSRDKYSSPKTLDESKAAFEKAKFELAQANLALEMSKKNLDILATEKLLAIEDLEESKQSEIIASDDLKNTIITSPIDGIAASSGMRKGNFVRPGQPLVSVVPKTIFIKANFKETQAAKFTIGQEVIFEVDAVSGHKFTGKVKSISPATGSKFSLIPIDNATGNFTKIVQRIPVIIEFDPTQQGAELIRTGMSTKVSIRID